MALMQIQVEGSPPLFKDQKQLVVKKVTIGGAEIGQPIPADQVTLDDEILHEEERIPKTLGEIDEMLMDPKTGDAEYQRAQSQLFVPKGRTRLSQWMIDGARQNGFTCENLEAKVLGEARFTGTELGEIASMYKHALNVGGFSKFSIEYVLAHLTGEHINPSRENWRVLKAYGHLNPEIEQSYESLNEFDEEGKEGFYRSQRVYNDFRSIFRYKAVHSKKGQPPAKRKPKRTDGRKLSYEQSLDKYVNDLANDVSRKAEFRKVVSIEDMQPKEHGTYSKSNGRLTTDLHTTPAGTLEEQVSTITVKTKGVMLVDGILLEQIGATGVLSYLLQKHPELEATQNEALRNWVTLNVLANLTESQAAKIRASVFRQSTAHIRQQATKLVNQITDDFTSGNVDSSYDLPPGSFNSLFQAIKELYSQLPQDIFNSLAPLTKNIYKREVSETRKRDHLSASILEQLRISPYIFNAWFEVKPSIDAIKSYYSDLVATGGPVNKITAQALNREYMHIAKQLNQRKNLIVDEEGNLIGRAEFASVGQIASSYKISPELLRAVGERDRHSVDLPYKPLMYINGEALLRREQRRR